MKKLLVALAIVISMTACEERNDTERKESGISMVSRYEVEISHMHYVIYREIDGGLVAINVTKDSLETLYYKQQIITIDK